LITFRAYIQEQGRQHSILTASAVLCSSKCRICTVCPHHCQLCWVWWAYAWNTTGPPAYHTRPAEGRSLNGLIVAKGLRAHLHRHHLHDNRLGIPGKQTQVYRKQCYRRHRKHADSDLNVRLQGGHSAIKMMTQISIYIKSLVMRHRKLCGKDQHVHKTFCGDEMSQTLFLVET